MSQGNGKRLIDKITEGVTLERRSLHIPEWDTTLYFRPLTKAELEAAMPNDGVERSSAVESLLLLVHVAEDEQGAKVFQRTDVEKLRTRVPLQVLTRIETFMWGIQRPTVEQAKADIKNG